MRNTSIVIFGIALLSLGGCATVVKGTKQIIAVDTNPQGASCAVTRVGASVGTVDPTPGKIQVSRAGDPLTFSCTKLPEFSSVSLTVEPTFNGATLGNILLGGVIGVVVDASTGSNYSYPEQVTIDLVAGQPTAASAPVVPPPAEPAKPAEKPKAN